MLESPQTIPDPSPVQQYGEPELHRLLATDCWAAGQLVGLEEVEGVGFALGSRPSNFGPALGFALVSASGTAMLVERYPENITRKVVYWRRIVNEAFEWVFTVCWRK